MPTHSESMRNVAPPLQRSPRSRLRAWLVDETRWQPSYNSMVAAVVAVWITAALIGLAAWAQVYASAAERAESAASVGGE